MFRTPLPSGNDLYIMYILFKLEAPMSDIEVTRTDTCTLVWELADSISVIGLNKIGLVKPNDDLPQLILDAMKAENMELNDGDIIVVSQKIVSKADGLLVDISEIKPHRRSRLISRRTRKDPRLIEVILRDSAKVLRADSQALVVRRKDGFVCLNAGVDKSNVRGRTVYSRLPENADDSAKELRGQIEKLSGRSVGVIVADTYSRPFRVGQVEFAIGISGIEPIVDYRGQKDLFGYELRYKFIALADEIAAAAELVMGQGNERVPVAIIRGLNRVVRTEERGLSKKLLLGRQVDLFTKSR
jgi:coenzyme F420-0:L-glutamate ligase/coenzyme F420-1:gamma-L-glutamate ligase